MDDNTALVIITTVFLVAMAAMVIFSGRGGKGNSGR